MRILKNLIGIAILSLLVIGIVNFNSEIKPAIMNSQVGDFIRLVQKRIDVFKHNLSFTVSPQRRRPFDLLAKESRLIHMAPNTFGQYGPSDWGEFWNVVYQPLKEKEGSFMVKRYRTKGEIESWLVSKHSKPFSKFTEKHWKYFWDIIFKQ